MPRRLHAALAAAAATAELQMGRLHSKGKGVARSALPYKRSPPQWLKATSTEVEEHVCRLAKKGLRPSAIGVILRDANGIAQVRT